MKIGIVGSEAKKFTPDTEEAAREEIRRMLVPGTIVVSGKCHLGGIDIWAIEEAKKLGLQYIEYPPLSLNWTGYKERNLLIAEDSDRVVCITVRKLPDNYTGMRFSYCYHCNTDTHVKSGGCWTVKQAIHTYKKPGEVIVIG